MAEPPLIVDIDAAALRQLVADMKTLEGGKPQVAALRRNLKAAAEPAAAQIRANASWSTRIPAAVGVRVAFAANRDVGVAIFVNRRKAPHARPLEGGSTKNVAMNRHPVFKAEGHPGTWVNQPLRPFFFGQAERHLSAVEQATANAIQEAAREAGYRV